jgi:hypothetical protein
MPGGPTVRGMGVMTAPDPQPTNGTSPVTPGLEGRAEEIALNLRFATSTYI